MTPDLAEWYRGRRVFITGHTGFKGAWLAAWLRSTGATVAGYALPPPNDRPSLFSVAHLGADMESVFADLRDPAMVEEALRANAPEVVFHLAAQSLVRRSYREPVETYATNVMGTAHLLDATRRVPSVRAIVVVTSDKCYENRNLDRGYREDDPMGGHDPYSSSKGCVELLTAAFRRSFFSEGPVAIASARAGNVIGGGDWAEDRLVPDLMQMAGVGAAATVRYPEAVRPWQFVLEPLRGYLALGRALVERGHEFAEAWNFGPREADAVSVGDLVGRIGALWGRVDARLTTNASGPHEARTLRLDCAKSLRRLGWGPVLTLDEAVEMTVTWYRRYFEAPQSAPSLVRDQLGAYTRRVAEAGGLV